MSKAGKKRERDRIRVVLIGGGKGGSSILKELSMLDHIIIMGLADNNPQAPGIALAESLEIPVWQDFRTMLGNPNYDVVIEATGIKEVSEEIDRVKSPPSVLIVAEAARLMMLLVEHHEELRNIKWDVERLSAIMDAAQEGIQMADNEGTILYINKAFTWITKTKPEERIGQNVFEVSPEGALAEVLRTGKPVFGKRNMVMNTGVEVLSNASPLMINGHMQGAVVLFRNVSDIQKLSQKLGESREVIRNLKEEISELAAPRYTFDDIVGESEALTRQLKIARYSAKDAYTVLITGESGTGKELLAHAIHSAGPRAGGPFVKVDCTAIPLNLLESILFGYEKGAYTGADKRKMGKFELASGGTIFLDEIGELDIQLQAKLLRVLQDREMERLGGTYPIKLDVRIIAATNRDLKAEVDKGKFRLDLYYRLNVINVELPPLRQRKEDIDLLAAAILLKKNARHQKSCVFASGALQALQDYDWPGNLRELENAIERAVILSETPVITRELIQVFVGDKKENPIFKTLREVELENIWQALQRNGRSLEGKKKSAAELGISLATLYNKLERYPELGRDAENRSGF